MWEGSGALVSSWESADLFKSKFIYPKPGHALCSVVQTNFLHIIQYHKYIRNPVLHDGYSIDLGLHNGLHKKLSEHQCQESVTGLTA